MKYRIAFFGTSRLAQIVIEKLIDSPFKPAFAVTAPDKKSGRGQKIRQSPVKQTALENNIKTSDQLPETSDKFDLAILVAYGKIIPKEVLEIPKHGIVNVHPSLLPKYRGPSPIQTAILDGVDKTGVAIIKLDEEVDHGPILAQKEVQLEKADTHASLIEKLGEIGAGLLIETLPQYLNGSLSPKEQDHKHATFTEKIKKSDGEIDFENLPDKKTLDRMIRAYYPWPTAWGEIESSRQGPESKIKIKLLPPTILPSYHPTDPFIIQPEGKRQMTIKEFLNGYPQPGEKIRELLR